MKILDLPGGHKPAGKGCKCGWHHFTSLPPFGGFHFPPFLCIRTNATLDSANTHALTHTHTQTPHISICRTRFCCCGLSARNSRLRNVVDFQPPCGPTAHPGTSSPSRPTRRALSTGEGREQPSVSPPRRLPNERELASTGDPLLASLARRRTTVTLLRLVRIRGGRGSPPQKTHRFGGLVTHAPRIRFLRQ